MSEWIKREAEKSILKNNNIVTIYNWVDLKKFYPRNNKKDKIFTILGVSARWTNDMPKLRDFVKMAKNVAREHKNVTYRRNWILMLFCRQIF